MSEIGRSGRTIVFVSHDLGAVQQLCSRTLWIDAGRVRADGPTGEVIAEYLRSGLAGSSHVEFGEEAEGPVALTSVSLLGESGEPMELLRRDDAFTVRLRFTTSRPLPDLDVAVYLADRRGIQVLDEAWSDTGRPSDNGRRDGDLRDRSVPGAGPRAGPLHARGLDGVGDRRGRGPRPSRCDDADRRPGRRRPRRRRPAIPHRGAEPWRGPCAPSRSDRASPDRESDGPGRPRPSPEADRRR